ncbi:lysine N(6)-hydroxylase/L-ornithine N(5)-oxygenase family protein [Reyranella sp. CPCC 100927]|uniref:lysine N(6)-hydroxylase/L-ornithine N(5)-oxygenase family protein n=1 Tax=Reyranella sp. CPCC 100927 TaxID=2599616 RepID=UPI0011B49F89|nr:lysine N(6)-hydroxylase/L-ornithine N(5)-oxygenase family protein [Reyranella sp. CPCC 100927]TWT12529.1 lysine N(6)-hydroxylase/L-ornithine N(5)-oxygenase family protein [Reyranella sp. CPCC 100927]
MPASDTIHDVIGVGFGPSNLALAIALEEIVVRSGSPCDFRFIEKQNAFSWHGGMLLPDSRMQVSFLKDLVSLRDPTSPFSFVNYLHKQGRLIDFINQKTFFPSRLEFNAYLRWAAAAFDHRCCYGEEVLAVRPVEANGSVTHLCVVSRTVDGAERQRQARHLVVATGGSPHVPDVFQPRRGDARVFHSAAYLHALGRLDLGARAPSRIAVVGGGQSAAEIFLDLHERFSTTSVDMIIRKHALRPADDSPLANQIFDPQFTDLVFHRSEAQRRDMLREFSNTNYSVADPDLIRRIAAILYQQKILGAARHALLPTREVLGTEANASGVTLVLQDTVSGLVDHRTYDAVILATGYSRDIDDRLVAGLRDQFSTLVVDRHYGIQTPANFQPSIFLQGFCETTHGLSDTLLSVLVPRAEEIARAVMRSLPSPGRMTTSRATAPTAGVLVSAAE